MTPGTRHGVLLICGSILPVMAVVTLVPVVPALAREFAGQPGAAYLIPIALTLPALCVALFSPLVGMLADRFGRKPLLIGALILYAAVGSLPVLLSDLRLIVASRGLLGIAEAAIMTLSTTLLADYFSGARLQRWIAIQVGAVSIGAILLTALGGLLAELAGSRGPFLVYVLAIPLALIFAFQLPEPARTRHGPAIAFPFRAFVPLLAATLGTGLIFYTLFLQLGAVLGGIGVTSPGLIGIAAAIANVGNALGAASFRLFGSRWPQMVFPAGLAAAAAGYIGVTFAGDFVTATAFATLASLGAGTLLPALLSRMLDQIPPELRGRGTGLWTGTFFVAQFASPILAVALAGMLGGMNVVFLAIGGLAALSALLLLLAGAGRAQAASASR